MRNGERIGEIDKFNPGPRGLLAALTLSGVNGTPSLPVHKFANSPREQGIQGSPVANLTIKQTCIEVFPQFAHRLFSATPIGTDYPA